jgi:hypothetical protein
MMNTAAERRSISMKVLGPAILTLAVVAPPAPSGEPSPEPGRVETSASLYVRADTDHTTVVSPRARLRTRVGDERSHLDVVYAVDAWTSASIDVRTAASPTVREQRDELGLGLDRAWAWGRIALGYRLSHEVDYLSNSAALSVEADALQRSVTLSASAFAGGDVVGRAGDEGFRRAIGYGGLHLGYTHVLTKTTLLQAAMELRGQHGYLASPYRWVSLGAAGSCAHAVGLCIPEQHPDRRIRATAVVRARQALSRRWSLGAGYRLYGDSWGVLGHTGILDLRVMPMPAITLGLEGRGYTQGAAEFYRAAYSDVPAQGFVTRDRELSSMWNARIGLLADGRFSLGRGIVLTVGALVAGGTYGYRAFFGLERVAALEVSGSVGVSL